MLVLNVGYDSLRGGRSQLVSSLLSQVMRCMISVEFW